MKLFDGTTNYELGNVGLQLLTNQPVKIMIELFKDTTVFERPGQEGEVAVIRTGKEYEIPGLHDKILNIDVRFVGSFATHAMDPVSVKRLIHLTELTMKHPRAELYLTVKLRGDAVPSEPGMAPFEVKLMAKPGDWSAFPYVRPKFDQVRL